MPGNHGIRAGRQPQPARQRISMSRKTLFMVFIVLIVLLYMFSSPVRDNYKNNEEERNRCISELANVKYQLDTVSTYKKKMDIILSELQRESNLQKESIKEFANNYKVLKHHMGICEMQTQQLQAQSKELKAKLATCDQELASCKNPG